MASRYARHEKLGEIHVVELLLPDMMDSLEFDTLNEHLEELLGAGGGDGGAWVVDLSGTNYVGSAVLGLLVNIRQQLKTRGEALVLCGLRPKLEEIFEVGSLGRLFVVAKTRELAMAQLG